MDGAIQDGRLTPMHRIHPLKEMIQVILTDVEMPEMDGYMLTRKIKADKRFTGIPVLMHSSLVQFVQSATGQNGGCG